jgi:beta-mannosidase
VDFGGLEADVSDNALTLLPGERLSLRVTAKTDYATLRKALRLRSVEESMAPASVFTKKP